MYSRLNAGGHGTRGERTKNIQAMFVTLDVSKLSGWLNTYAFCRESKGGHTVRGELWAGRREMLAGRRGAHIEHFVHVRDAGCVEAQRLVKHVRVLPSRTGGIRCGMRCSGRRWEGVERRRRKRCAEGGPE